MRLLQLQGQNLTGPDVADWQTFLEKQNLFRATIDGIFGPKSDLATRSYQTNTGLTSDGVVRVDTMAKALIDGYQSTMGASIGGMDSNIDCSSFASQISNQEMKFVARYYSDHVAKALTASEAQALSGAGLAIVTVFENSNNSADLFSSKTGQSQAATALEQAAAVGQPAGTAIFFAVDYDATTADVQGPINDYFNAVRSAFAAATTQFVVGVYGSGLTCRVIRDAGLAKFTWITGSIGFAEYAGFRKQADIVQLAPERTLLNGLSIDDDIGQSEEFGAFRLPQAAATIMP
jgi:peptidoglycan hydrolase-like protein with peptidoglycan-binding domain